MNELALLLLLMAVAIVAGYFYLKRRQQQIHRDSAAVDVAHRDERDLAGQDVDADSQLDGPPHR